jgi:hypothetical protein
VYSYLKLVVCCLSFNDGSIHKKSTSLKSDGPKRWAAKKLKKSLEDRLQNIFTTQ